MQRSANQETTKYIGQVWEGRFENEKWVTIRMLNGDDPWHNKVLRVIGRENETNVSIEDLSRSKEGEHFTYSPATSKKIVTPGV